MILLGVLIMLVLNFVAVVCIFSRVASSRSRSTSKLGRGKSRSTSKSGSSKSHAGASKSRAASKCPQQL